MNLEDATAKIAALEVENQALRDRLAELERRLGLNSSNSSKPPSSDGFQKPPRRTQSLRASSQRKSGGQPGHRGHTLEAVLSPDVVVSHRVPSHCGTCGCDVWHVPVSSIVKRQVFDIPACNVSVTEHQLRVKQCPGCAQKVHGDFPPHCQAPVQYGPRLRAIAMYLSHQHFLPEGRISEFLSDLFGCSMVPATLSNLTTTVSETLEPVVKALALTIKSAPTKHLDETGLRIVGKTQWLHVVSTATATWYRCNVKRKDLAPLTGMEGVVVHDHWKPYFQLKGVGHALCNAHHLRELTALQEIDKESWATSMRKLLQLACGYQHLHPKGIPLKLQARIKTLYRKIVARGLAFHDALAPLPKKSKRGRPKRRVGHNLLLRLRDYAADVLRFVADPQIPFSNNQAERDLRMMKLKQKISGGFRSQKGARDFAAIRSVLSTARKRGMNLLELLTDAVQGQIPQLS